METIWGEFYDDSSGSTRERARSEYEIPRCESRRVRSSSKEVSFNDNNQDNGSCLTRWAYFYLVPGVERFSTGGQRRPFHSTRIILLSM